MKAKYTDAHGYEWRASCVTYLENHTPGHNKFYRAGTVVGPLGNWDFAQWGAIEHGSKGSQTQVWPSDGRIGKKLAAKRSTGYRDHQILDREEDLHVWFVLLAVVRAEHARLNSTNPAPLWTFEFVPEAHQ